MHQTFKSISYAIFLISCIASSIVKAGTTTKPIEPKTELNVKYLFVQNANYATIEPVKDKPNTYTITLKQISPLVIFISDRPNRKTGQLPVEQFIKLWESKGSDSFKDNPPNAVLSSVHNSLFFSDKNANYGFELSSPSYDAKTKTLSYTAKGLEGTSVVKESQTLEHISLFIDDVCLSCWGNASI